MSIHDNLIQMFLDAEEEAFDKEILNNAIVLNEKHDYTKAFVFENTIVPPMLLGKQVIVADLPDKYSFALIKVKEPNDKFKEFYEIIKQKRDNAKLELDNASPIDYSANIELLGEINAYNDVLSLMESIFEVKDETN